MSSIELGKNIMVNEILNYNPSYCWFNDESRIYLGKFKSVLKGPIDNTNIYQFENGSAYDYVVQEYDILKNIPESIKRVVCNKEAVKVREKAISLRLMAYNSKIDAIASLEYLNLLKIKLEKTKSELLELPKTSFKTPKDKEEAISLAESRIRVYNYEISKAESNELRIKTKAIENDRLANEAEAQATALENSSPQMSGGFYKKYLKYKQKYIQLKETQF